MWCVCVATYKELKLYSIVHVHCRVASIIFCSVSVQYTGETIYHDKENACDIIIDYPNYRDYIVTPVFHPPLCTYVCMYVHTASSPHNPCCSTSLLSLTIQTDTLRKCSRWLYIGLPARQLFECSFVDHVHCCSSSLATGGLLVLNVSHPALDLERVTQDLLFIRYITLLLCTRDAIHEQGGRYTRERKHGEREHGWED